MPRIGYKIFRGEPHYRRDYFFAVSASSKHPLLQSNKVDKIVTFSEKIFLLNSYFWSKYIFRTVNSLLQIFFKDSFSLRPKLLSMNYWLMTKTSVDKLILENSFLFAKKNWFRIKIPKENPFF